MDKLDKFNRQNLIRFAYTKYNYRDYIFRVLGEKPFLAKILTTVGIKRVKLETDEDLKNIFHDTIIKKYSYKSAYEAYGSLHENTIKSLESDYEKFLALASHFEGSNLEIDNDDLLLRFFDLVDKGLSSHSIDKIKNQLQIYPLPSKDIFDSMEKVLDIGKQEEFLAYEKNHMIKFFIDHEISNLYIEGLENPDQGTKLLEELKEKYKDADFYSKFLNDYLNYSST